ncbi:hypothetical protein MED134_08191 [Dokdonia sp. MED134]|uniref:DUF1440 domain-containing protein n=1 Tax=Dokdonia sp. MED134 TaxID=313590 RepID=UPI000068D082|nr:DUF1440 domain-containing protein [Dokdonia sp. MED134]EAQ39455.1 hypothetical protein MED134_08191 [Dokdonia sp. MED134]
MSNSALSNWLEKDTMASTASRGVISGVLGGLAGTIVKTAIEHFLPVRQPNTESAQLKLVDNISEKLTGEPVSASNRDLAEQLVNIPIGVTLGASLGYTKRDRPETNVVEGALFGTTAYLATHETSLPLMGLEEAPEDIPVKLQANEFLAHVAFGITAELVRGWVARKLDD